MNQSPPAEPLEVPPKGILRDYLETIVTCVIFVLFARTFVFQQSKIPTGSMIPTLLIGDYIMVNKHVYAPSSFAWEKKLLPIRDIRRGDIIVFKYPEEPEKDYIKRVIGLPGDVIEIDGSQSPPRVRIEPSGKGAFVALTEPYVATGWNALTFCCRQDGTASSGTQPITLSGAMYFVLGDNRNFSADSRSFGLVPAADILGKVLYRISGGGVADIYNKKPTLAGS